MPPVATPRLSSLVSPTPALLGCESSRVRIGNAPPLPCVNAANSPPTAMMLDVGLGTSCASLRARGQTFSTFHARACGAARKFCRPQIHSVHLRSSIYLYYGVRSYARRIQNLGRRYTKIKSVVGLRVTSCESAARYTARSESGARPNFRVFAVSALPRFWLEVQMVRVRVRIVNVPG
ncbi:hypothetical protein B0H14DRAFT_2755652 [Mycena olivaceomarginata]|nr:hypothetical protein B0H14DRAFT_2755652 [Mycena olivaceomarginata]